MYRCDNCIPYTIFILIYVHLVIDLYVQALFSSLYNPVLSLIIESLPV